MPSSDSSLEPPPITDEQLMRLKLARILPQRYRLTDWCKFIHRRVSPEKAARYLELYTPQGQPDVEKLKEQIAERSFLATPHGQGYIITVADLLGYEGTSRVEFAAAPCGEAPPLRVGWQSFVERLMQWKGVLGVLAFLVAVLGVLAQMVDIRPPRTMLTIVLDASAPMGRFVSVDRTLWDVALDIAQSRLPNDEYSKHERVAIWIERGIPSSDDDCTRSHSRLTKGYVPSEGLEIRSLAANIQPMGLPNPGPALREAMRGAPNSLLRNTNHRAVILTSGAQTCSGKSPIEEICEVLTVVSLIYKGVLANDGLAS